MSAQHFKELLGVMWMTKGLSVHAISKVLKVSKTTIYRWRDNGVPVDSAIYVGHKLRTYIRG